MDEIDLDILEILQKDGRISMKKLAEQIHMSSPSTIERVRRLEENRSILGYRAVVRPDRVGLQVNTFVLVIVDPNQQEELYRFVRESARIVAAYVLLGKYGLMLQISCPDMEDYLHTIYLIQKFGFTESYPICDLLKTECYKRLTGVVHSDHNFVACGEKTTDKA